MDIREAIITAGKDGGITISSSKVDGSIIFVPDDSPNCVKIYDKDTGKFIGGRWNPKRLDLIRGDWEPIKKEVLVKDFHIDLKASQD